MKLNLKENKKPKNTNPLSNKDKKFLRKFQIKHSIIESMLLILFQICANSL